MKLEKEQITLRDELSILEHYVNIMKLRYTNLFEVITDIDERFLDYGVPPLILQPLVENAIYHGTGKPGMTIRVEVEDAGRDFLLRVRDNGSGMTDSVLKRLRDSLTAGETSERIGISNVNERIRLKYGEPYGLTIESEFNVGTTVTLRLPKPDRAEGLQCGIS
jgi:two-component system sensor histidine kinase YesM